MGEGITENTQLKYRIQYNGTNNARPFDITISFKEQNEKGEWIAHVTIFDNGTELSSNAILKESDLAPLDILSNSTSLEPYIDAYSHSIQSASSFAWKENPASLEDRDWGGLACEGCPKIELHSLETVSVQAGIFNTTLVSYAQELKLWILDDFPYPVKGISYELTTKGLAFLYSYELLEATINGIVIPEFDQAFLLVIFALTFTVFIMRLSNKIKWPQITSVYCQ